MTEIYVDPFANITENIRINHLITKLCLFRIYSITDSQKLYRLIYPNARSVRNTIIKLSKFPPGLFE